MEYFEYDEETGVLTLSYEDRVEFSMPPPKQIIQLGKAWFVNGKFFPTKDAAEKFNKTGIYRTPKPKSNSFDVISEYKNAYLQLEEIFDDDPICECGEPGYACRCHDSSLSKEVVAPDTTLEDWALFSEWDLSMPPYDARMAGLASLRDSVARAARMIEID